MRSEEIYSITSKSLESECNRDIVPEISAKEKSGVNQNSKEYGHQTSFNQDGHCSNKNKHKYKRLLITSPGGDL